MRESAADAASFKISVMKNVRWTALSAVGRLIIAGGTWALLAHFVEPKAIAAYGIAWSGVAIGFAVCNNGVGQSVIAVPNVSQGHYSAAQAVLMLVAAVVSGCLMLTGLILPRFYSVEDLYAAFIIGALTVPLMSIAAVDTAVEQKELRFNSLAGIQLGAMALSAATSLIFVASGFSLVGLFALQGFSGLYSFILFRLLGRPSHFRSFSVSDLLGVWHIGSHMTFSSLTGVLGNAFLQLVLAATLAPEEFGLYTFVSRTIQIIGTQLSAVAAAVIFPTLSRLKRDPSEVGRAFISLSPILAGLMMLVMLPFIVAPEAFLIFYAGDKWKGGAEVLRYLGLMTAMTGMGVGVFATFQVLGMPQVAWKWNLLLIGVQTVAVLASKRGGMVSITQSIAASSLLTPLALYGLSRLAEFNFLAYLRAISPAFLYVVPSVAVGFYVSKAFSTAAPVIAFSAPAMAACTVYSAQWLVGYWVRQRQRALHRVDKQS
jgi:O-antigen/teichoic acid export membrane protein